jgi:hypothetical protein
VRDDAICGALDNGPLRNVGSCQYIPTFSNRQQLLHALAFAVGLGVLKDLVNQRVGSSNLYWGATITPTRNSSSARG